MKFKSLDEFTKDYKQHGYIDKISSRYYPLKELNPKQISTYYLQYIKKWDKKYGDKNFDTLEDLSDDSKLSELVRKRDGVCRLLQVLSASEYLEWQKNHNGIGYTADAAHVFGKNAFPWMRFDHKNVVLLNRFSHSCLDTGKSPINGKMISDEERMKWWQRIVLNEKDWAYLEAQSNKRN